MRVFDWRISLLLVFSVWGMAQTGDSCCSAGIRPKSRRKEASTCVPASVASLNMSLLPSLASVNVSAESTCEFGARIRFSRDNKTDLYTYSNDYDSLLYMFPAGPYSDLLISVWEGGAHVGVRIFHVSSKSIRVVFDSQVKIVPDFILGPSDGPLMAVYDPGTNPPVTADIYSWNGKSFRKLRTVPSEHVYDTVRDILK